MSDEHVKVSQIQLHLSKELKRISFPPELEPGGSYEGEDAETFKELPLDLTTLTHTALGSHLGYWMNWANKARRAAALADIEYENRARIYNLYFSRAYMAAEAKTATDKKHEANLAKVVIDAEFEQAKAKALYEYCKALFEEYMGNYGAISREITRRERLLT